MLFFRMITQADLQSIGSMMDQKLEKQFDVFAEKIDNKLDKRLQEYDSKMDQRFDTFEKEILINQIQPMRLDIKKIYKKLDTIIKFFDKDIVTLHKRIDRIENHLNLPPLT